MNIRVKQIVKNNGYSLLASGAVRLNLIAAYSELTGTIEAFQLLNNDVTIKAKVKSRKPIMLGSFRLKQVVIDGDGESKLKFEGLSDYIEVDNLSLLPLKTDDIQDFTVMYEAEIEEE